MKIRVLSQLSALVLLVLIVALSGCGAMQTAEQKVDAAEEQVEQKLDAVEEQMEQALEPQVTPPAGGDAASDGALTKEEAEAIALAHAGFTADQVKGLHSSYEVDDRVPEYEVEFFQDGWEYDYTIHAETGEILTYDKDN